MGNALYKIRHYDIRLLSENGFALTNDVENGLQYWVLWCGQIPLGHLWVEEDLKNSHGELLHNHIWQSIKETLKFYCADRKEIEFNRLSFYWENKEGDSFLSMLDHLFTPFAAGNDNYSSIDLTLVICTRNRPLQLKNCLDSLSLLSHHPKEIIVVDNASENNGVKELASRYPNIKYVLEDKIGLDNARNAGWQQATSSLVAYMDDDVTLHKDYIWAIESAFDDPRVMAVTGLVFATELATKAQVIFEKYWSFNRGYQDIYYDADYFRKYLKDGVPAWDVGAGANMAFRRSALEAAGGFDKRLDVGASGCSGDSEMWYRLMAAGWTIHYTPRAISFHTHRKEMTSLKRQIYYYMRGNTSSLLVQYQRHKHSGNLRHLFKTLPVYYTKSFLRSISHPHATQYETLFWEMAGSLSGICYFIRHRKLSPENQFSHHEFLAQKERSVSVIITTYNHARYIGEAIESVLKQSHIPDEIIVIDDGSTDNTGEIVAQFPMVRYVYQNNKGLSAARNIGIFMSKGNYIVFLDADDLLYPSAIAKNLHYFELHPSSAFISGWHDKIDEQKKLIDTYESKMPQEGHYMALLRGNYIGMHATVMYQREIFNIFLFDETLPACEDYDLYIRIAKKYSVFSHNEKLAAYRIHSNNMSKDIDLMLEQVKTVLRKNADLRNAEVKRNYKEGIKNWTAYYSREMYRRTAFRYLYPGYKHNLKDLLFVTAKMPKQMIRLFLHKTATMIRRNKAIPKPGKIHLGDLRRTMPVSKEFGYDRGGPVDRYYIENFLKENSEYISGRVLEIGDNAYTMAYGGKQVMQSDILYIDDSNPQATIIGDLSMADHIPSDQFDCIILTQTLHLIYDFHAAIRQCHRMLKTGGTLLLTVPGITQIDYGEWGDTWYWSFTGRAIQRLLSDHFHPENLLVQTHGNVLAAAAFLYGLGQKEITDREKNENDPHYQVIVTARATKR